MLTSKKPRRLHAATLADVGRASGVSAMAASVVLNGAQTSSRIAPETRQRILEAAARLHYRPNAAARALANRCMQTIGVAVVFEGSELNHYTLEILNGILEAADRNEYTTTIFTLHNWDKDTARLPSFCDGRIDGMILIAPTFTSETAKILPHHTPFVSLHANTALPNVINVESDEERGANDIVKLLIKKGHRRILHIAGTPGLLGTERRLRGYKKALRGAKIRVDEDLIVSAGLVRRDGYNALRNWLRSHEGEALPDAVFCVTDGVAAGCLEALAEVGLRVPNDLSLVGFDDTLVARTTVPQLTTVKQPLHAMGMRATEVLIAQIQKRSASPLRKASPAPIVFPVNLVQRSSLGVPGATRKKVPSR
jgi:LacI family transcriptional regulator